MALSSPNRILLLRNTAVSGVFTYLPPALSSAFSTRPLNPTARPSSSRIVNMTRPRNRSYTLPFSLVDSSPAASSAFMRALPRPPALSERNPQPSGAYPSPHSFQASSSSARPFR